MSARRLTDEDIAAAMEMRSDNLQWKYIAEAYSMSAESLRVAVDRAKKRGIIPHRNGVRGIDVHTANEICKSKDKQEVIAIQFGISRSSVSHIRKGRKSDLKKVSTP